jgi:hypothetical protein
MKLSKIGMDGLDGRWWGKYRYRPDSVRRAILMLQGIRYRALQGDRKKTRLAPSIEHPSTPNSTAAAIQELQGIEGHSMFKLLAKTLLTGHEFAFLSSLCCLRQGTLAAQ